MTDYSVKPPLVESLAAALDSSAASVHSSLGALSRSSSTLAGQWRGDAAEAYRERQATWLQEMSAHTRALEGAADAARAAAQAYASADDRVGQLWSIG